MRFISGIIEHITRRGVNTICHPRAIVDEDLTVSTIPDSFFKAYIVPRDKLSVTESGGLLTRLPKKSNIRELESEIDKVAKKWGGFRASHNDSSAKSNQLSWIDGFNRYMSTKVETQDGISYTLRADVANELSQRGNMLVQCDEAFCDILLPSKLSVDMNKYSVAEDK